MSDTASGSRGAGSSSLPARPGSSFPNPPTDSDVLPLQDDQLTVISNGAPLAAEPTPESVGRIIQGKILPGDTLGHFELVEYIGGGGMGRVYRAIDQRLGRTVALKVLAPEHSIDKESVRRFHSPITVGFDRNRVGACLDCDEHYVVDVFYSSPRAMAQIAFRSRDHARLDCIVEIPRSTGPPDLASCS